MEYISTPEEESFLVNGEAYETDSISSYITVELVDWAEEGYTMPQELLTAIFTREQGPYEMLVKEFKVYSYNQENGEFENVQEVPLTE